MVERIIFKFLNFTVTQSRKQDDIVFNIRDNNNEVISGDFVNIGELLDAVDELERCEKQKIGNLN